MKAKPQNSGQSCVSAKMDQQLLDLGRLHFLASFCPTHRKLPGAWLARIFIPAVNNNCVRFFHNDDGNVCAALIWARLTEEAADQMLGGAGPPAAEDWAAGSNLWFLDLLAPFNHGRKVARLIARQPPQEPFFFARLNARGKVHKVVRGDASARGADRVRSFFVDAMNERHG